LLDLEVWKFQVDVLDEKMIQSFTCQTDKTWREFSEEAYSYFTAPRSEVWLGYRCNRESATAYLRTEQQWAKALVRLRGKMRAARKLPVTIEVKNVVSHTAYNNERM
jgi:hypothetical protein